MGIFVGVYVFRYSAYIRRLLFVLHRSLFVLCRDRVFNKLLLIQKKNLLSFKSLYRKSYCEYCGIILALTTILTNRVYNQILFWNFDILRDYYNYSLHIKGPKWLSSLKILVELGFKSQKLGSWIHAFLGISQFISNRVNFHSYLTTQISLAYIVLVLFVVKYYIEPQSNFEHSFTSPKITNKNVEIS